MVAKLRYKNNTFIFMVIPVMKYDIYGIGNALVDSEFEVNDDFLNSHEIEKGLMTLIDEEKQHSLFNALNTEFGVKKRAGGGSAANTIVAASQFGAKTFYACKVANDEDGHFYGTNLHEAGVDNRIADVHGEGVTGKCMVMVTPDAERTMNTYLGITADFSASELHFDELKTAQYLYVEGYLVTSDISRNAVLEARKVAAENDVKTAMTFSDPAMAAYFKDGLTEMLGEGVDLLFCNVEEAQTYTGTDNLDDAITALQAVAKKLVVTLGSDGAVVIDGEQRTSIAATPTTAVDTNGAGDMFAGSFLYGVTQGMSDAQAGKLASMAASEIVSVFGARLEQQTHQDLLAKL